MSNGLKKLLVLLPVLLLGLIYLYDHTRLYGHTSGRRLLFLAFSFLVLYVWICWETFSRKQDSYRDIAVQASFFLYVFMILALTGYFNLFREIASNDWWYQMMQRVDRKDHVNLKLFQIFRIYKNTDTQIFGNLVMLFPLGIYVPLLYKNLSNFFVTVLFCFFVSCMIECVQLATRFRSADVDDVFLNTMGAAAGAFVFAFINHFLKRPATASTQLEHGTRPLA